MFHRWHVLYPSKHIISFMKPVSLKMLRHFYFKPVFLTIFYQYTILSKYVIIKMDVRQSAGKAWCCMTLILNLNVMINDITVTLAVSLMITVSYTLHLQKKKQKKRTKD